MFYWHSLFTESIRDDLMYSRSRTISYHVCTFSSENRSERAFLRDATWLWEWCIIVLCPCAHLNLLSTALNGWPDLNVLIWNLHLDVHSAQKACTQVTQIPRLMLAVDKKAYKKNRVKKKKDKCYWRECRSCHSPTLNATLLSFHFIHAQPLLFLSFILSVCDNPPLFWLSPSAVSWVWLDFLFVRVLKLSRSSFPAASDTRCFTHAVKRREEIVVFYNRWLIPSLQEAQSHFFVRLHLA